jgi:hypothetical protein
VGLTCLSTSTLHEGLAGCNAYSYMQISSHARRNGTHRLEKESALGTTPTVYPLMAPSRPSHPENRLDFRRESSGGSNLRPRKDPLGDRLAIFLRAFGVRSLGSGINTTYRECGDQPAATNSVTRTCTAPRIYTLPTTKSLCSVRHRASFTPI